MANDFGFRLGVEGEKDFKQALSDINKNFKVLGSEMKLVASQFEKNDNSIGALSSRNEVLNKQIDEQKNKIETLRAALKNASESFGENDKRTKNWQIQLNNAEAALNGMERELKDNQAQMNKVGDSADHMGHEIEESGKEAERSTGRFDGLKSALTAIGATMGAVAAAAGAAAIKLGKEVVTAYADFEQLKGGVETLFDDSAGQVEKYATDAFKSAGMSANEYLETVTGFSASLIQALGGDTEKAAKLADQAVIDMSDNANKMGTDISSIQDAYQGFAKQNYTMLDNLKLGYGGTKTEMERLLKDADALSESFNLQTDETGNLVYSYADIVEAIHLVQKEMGIAGTTEKEATETIAGSINMTKSAFQNLVAGLGDADADIGKLSNDLVSSFSNVLTNIEPVIKSLVGAIPTAAKTLFGSISELLPTVLEAVTSIASALLEEAPSILGNLFSGISDLLPGILDFALNNVLPNLVTSVLNIGAQLFSSLSEALPDLMTSLSESLVTITTELFSADNITGAVEMLLGFIQNVIAGIQDALPILIEGVFQLVTGIVEALPDIIKMILEALPTIIDMIVDTITDCLPALIDGVVSLIDGIVQALPEIITAIIEALPNIIASILSATMDLLPVIIDGVIQLIAGLVKALPKLINSIIECLPDLIEMIGNTLIECLPELIEGNLKLILGLVEALPDLIVAILESLPDMINMFINSLLGCLPQLIKGVIQLVVGLVEHMPEIIKGLIDSVPTIIEKIVEAFKNGLSSIIAVGKNIVTGLWEGITGAASWLWEKITGWMKGIWDGIKNFFGIHSPSTKMRDMIGKNLVKGLAEGITDEGKTAVNAMTALSNELSAVTFSPITFKGITDDLSGAIPADFDSQMRASVLTASQYDSGARVRSASPTFNTNVTFGNVTINDGSDVEDIAHRVSDIIANDVMVKGGAFA